MLRSDRALEGGPRPRTILLLMAGFILLVLVAAFVAGHQQRIRAQVEMEGRLHILTTQRANILAARLDELRAQVRFLSLMPPVSGLARAEAGNGFDAQENSDAGLWRRRLDAIFKAYAMFRPGVDRLALLSARERTALVAVESHGGQIRARDTATGWHPELDMLDMLTPGVDVLISGPDLSREDNDPARRPHPLLRLAVAVPAADGGRFGALTLALDARELLAELARDINPIFQIYLLDEQGNFLLHPDPARSLTFATGHPYRWEDEFRALPDATRGSGARTFQGADGLVHVRRQRVALQAGNPGRELTIVTTISDRTIAESAANVRLWVAGLGLPLAGLLVLALVCMRMANRRDRQIRARDAWLGAIVDSASDAVIGLSHDGRISSWNDAATRMFGYTAADVMDRTTRSLIVPPDLEIQEDELLDQVRRGENVLNLRTRRLHRDGRAIDVSVTATPVQDGHGPAGAALIIRDISDQIAAEAGVRDLNSRLERQVRERTMEIEALAALRNAILHCAGSAIIACDRSGTITLFNPAAETMLGYDPQELLGKATPALFHDPAELGARGDSLQAEQGHSLLSAMDVLAAGTDEGGVEMREWTYLRKDGTRLPVLLAVTTLMDRDGGISGYLIIATDISSQMRDAARLREALAGAEASSRAKSAFLANMGHEIRTPLNGIIGSAHLMLDDPLTDSQRTHADSIRRAASALLTIVNDILDYSRIDAGLMALESSPFRLADPVTAVADLFAPVLRTRPVALEVSIDPALPGWVLGDAGRLRQILDNLVGNAVKFTPSGTIGVNLCRLGIQPDGRVDLSITVSDTGIGMGPEQVDRLFQAFAPGDDSHRRRHGGTGLGLALTQRLVQMMGGTIRAESVAGQGSRFIVDLCLMPVAAPVTTPATPSATPSIPSDDLSGLNGARILLVEDNELNQIVARGFLDRAGAVTTVAANGAEAVAAMEEQPFDLVLMDLQMPGLDGIAATRAIRGGSELNRDTPILAVSASVQPSDVEACRQAGMDDHIGKPISARELVGKVAHWIGAPQDPGSQRAAG